jgi:hypothetical protein
MKSRIDAKPLRIVAIGALVWSFFLTPVLEAQSNLKSARNRRHRTEASRDPLFEQYALYRKNAPRAELAAQPRTVSLPLDLEKGAHIAYIGNTLFERAGLFGFFESMMHAQFPKHALTVRNLSWSADTPDLQPRPTNFADLEQHLFREQADVIFAAFGFNESFDGEEGMGAFRNSLREFIISFAIPCIQWTHGT